MSTATTTICQRTVNRKYDETEVVFRRMIRKDLCAFMKSIAKHLASIGVDLNDVLLRLPEIIVSVDELSVDLLTKSSTLTKEAVDNLDIAQFADALDVALELNLGDDLKKSFAGIAKTLGGLRPMMTKKPGEESTSP